VWRQILILNNCRTVPFILDFQSFDYYEAKANIYNIEVPYKNDGICLGLQQWQYYYEANKKTLLLFRSAHSICIFENWLYSLNSL
jgi:hypothetical protein